MTKKTPKNPQISAINAAAEAVLADYDKLTESIETLRTVLTRGKGKPADTDRIARIKELLAAGKSVAEVVTETGASERTVRRFTKKPE